MDNFAAMVFKSVVKGDLQAYSLDDRMLGVLMAVDGQKEISAVAEKLQMPYDLLGRIIKHLYQKKLIVRIKKPEPVIDTDFRDFLSSQLAIALGPMAEILIEDEMEEISPGTSNIPCHGAAELVERLAAQIPRNERMLAFQKAMVEKINLKGY